MPWRDNSCRNEYAASKQLGSLDPTTGACEVAMIELLSGRSKELACRVIACYRRSEEEEGKKETERCSAT